ncbi:hypothetical protein PN4B1_04750 [Paenibacillus naphthalenovorans]|nr:hypothetical protein PN4B1_04750 [Paenibacillus naphthalenovorans]
MDAAGCRHYAPVNGKSGRNKSNEGELNRLHFFYLNEERIVGANSDIENKVFVEKCIIMN